LNTGYHRYVFREAWKSIRLLWAQPQGRGILFAVANIAAIGTVFYKLVEGWSWVDSFYFTMVTLTTVGFGDLAPSSDISKLFTVFLIVSGVGFILAFLNVLASMSVKRRTGQDLD
jgi:voltage-gated potassium channel